MFPFKYLHANYQQTHRLLLRLGKLVASLGELNDGFEKFHRYIKYQCDYTSGDPIFNGKKHFAPNFKALRRLHFSSSKSSNYLTTKYRSYLCCLVVVMLNTAGFLLARCRYFPATPHKGFLSEHCWKSLCSETHFASAYEAYLDGLKIEIINPPPSSCNSRELKVTQFIL